MNEPQETRRGRAWSIAPDVAEQIGPEQLRRMNDPEWDSLLMCSFCGEEVPSDVPAAAIVLEISGSSVAAALWAHETCHPSQILRLTSDEARVRFPALHEPGGSDVEVAGSVAVIDDEGTELLHPMLTISYTTEVRDRGHAESTDLVTTALLRQGWNLITTLEEGFADGPRGWSVYATPRPGGLTEVCLMGPSGPETAATIELPELWFTAAAERGHVGVLQGPRLGWEAGTGALERAIRDGRLTGGVVPVVVTG
ncbi:hypothetical protein [Amycolatopsis sp. NPDC051903]|uniref:hypothetical protein n=1 Tax=Amycolatopsis sp. NPDC051903 TaxID=3363936 RepID=UPI0037A76AAB